VNPALGVGSAARWQGRLEAASSQRLEIRDVLVEDPGGFFWLERSAVPGDDRVCWSDQGAEALERRQIGVHRPARRDPWDLDRRQIVAADQDAEPARVRRAEVGDRLQAVQACVAPHPDNVCSLHVFAHAQGLPLTQLVDTLGKGAGSSWYFVHRAPNMIRDSYPPGFKVRLHAKDLEICRDMAARFGVTLPVVERVLDVYAELMARGFGDEDISATYRLKSELFGA